MSIIPMQCTQSPYSAAWKFSGAGILIVMMFVIVASASTMPEPTAVWNPESSNSHNVLVDHGLLSKLITEAKSPVSHPIQLKLPVEQLRDAQGRMTSNVESLFSLLARRTKSLSLSITITAESFAEAEFATEIAARMLEEVRLESGQIRISIDQAARRHDSQQDGILTVTIARHEVIEGDSK